MRVDSVKNLPFFRAHIHQWMRNGSFEINIQRPDLIFHRPNPYFFHQNPIF